MTQHWRCGKYSLSLNRPLIMGIVNVTPDSFSDGGDHGTTESALAWAEQLLNEGADILDVGGESTRPGSDEVPEEVEAARVIPVIKALVEKGAVVSIDTRHASVAQQAVEAGVHILNDVSGFRDPKMVEVAANSDCGLVVMHMLGEPKHMQAKPVYADVVKEVSEYLVKQAAMLEAAGVERDRISIDPGPGFGKTTPHDLAMQRAFGEFSQLGYPVVEACSRKRFIGETLKLSAPKDRDVATVGFTLAAALAGANILRVHNVKALYEALAAYPLAPRKGYVALGSNMGQSLDTLASAREKINQIPTTRVLRSSHAYATEPAYVTDQATFTNAVVEVESQLGARELLRYLLDIEQEFGRVRTVADGPRTLDLDLLAYGDEYAAGSLLQLPHPRAFERDFVLTPLADLLSADEIDALLAPYVPLKKADRYGAVLEDLGAL